MSDLKTNLESILEEKQNKIIPENIKKDVQIFDITGTYEGNSGDVKLFETEEDMHLDETAKENDLAVIYRNETNNMVADNQVQYIIFPETVTLPIAVTESYFCMLRAADDSAMFDGQIMLDQTSFMFHGYSDTGVIDIQYDSTDGINYTRTTTITNPINLGTVANVYFPEEWNDNFGYFMQVDRSTFEGLYQYTINGRTNLFKTSFTSNISVSNENTTNWNENLDGPIYDKNKTTELIKKIRSYHDEVLETNASNSSYFFAVLKNQPVIICPVNAQGTKSIYNCKPVTVLDGSIAVGLTVYYNASGACIGPAYSSDGYKFEIFYLNYENMTYTKEYNNLISTSIFSYSTLISDIIPIRIDYDNGAWLFEFNELYAISISSTSSYVYDYITDINIYPSGYILAPSQLTLAASNELLPGKIAYGKNGIIIGDDSIYDNLDLDKILITYFGVDSAELKFNPSTVFSNSDTYIDGTKLALTINIPNGSGLYLEDGVPYHLTEMLTSTTNVATLVKKSTSSTTDKLSSSGTLLSRYDKIHRHMIDASYISSTDCIIQIFDENGTRIHNFSIPKTNISSYTYFAYYDNVLIYSTSGKGLFRYDILNQTETQLYSDAKGVPLYDHITNKVYIATSGTLYEYDITTKTRVTINTSIDLASACEKCIVYYASDTIYVKEIGDTTWLSQTGAVCSTTASSGIGREALVFYSQNMDKVYSMLIAKSGYYKDKTNVCEISLTDGTIRVINTNLSVDIGSIGKSSANTFDGEHVYIFDAWDIFEYIISTDTITKIGLPDIISTGSNSTRYLFVDFTKANEFKIMMYYSSGYANISRSVKTVQGILSNFESGINTTKLNFISNDKGNRCFIIGGNPIIDYNVNGTITPEEYDTALSTAKEIEGSE